MKIKIFDRKIYIFSYLKIMEADIHKNEDMNFKETV